MQFFNFFYYQKLIHNLYWLIFLFFISGYDFVILNDENLLFNIFLFLILFLLLNLKYYLVNFILDNKIKLLNEYYYKFYLIKSFYIFYIDYLQYNFLVLSNYDKYYNYLNKNLFNIFYLSYHNIYNLYIKFLFDYIKIFKNTMLWTFIDLKFFINLNLYYLEKIFELNKVL